MNSLRCPGIARDRDNERTLVLHFDRKPTDNEMRYFHEVVQRVCRFAKDYDPGELADTVPKTPGN